MLYNIKNEQISLTVTDKGGSMTSLIYLQTGEERLWQGNEFWLSQDVVIFPIIGHAGPYLANGKRYELKSHGLIRYATLTLKEQTQTKITLGYETGENPFGNYPYEFEFAISYELIENCVKVTYFVKSKKGNMPFYVGGHPGMYAPDGEVIIEFENEENPLVYPLNRDAAFRLEKVKKFIANKKFFAECKTFQLGSLSGGNIYATTKDGYRYTYKSDCPVVAFWSNEEGGNYVCVEPWWGINDFSSAPREITLKPFINFDSGKGSTFSYSLMVEKE